MLEKLIAIINNYGTDIFVGFVCIAVPISFIYRFDQMTPPGIPTMFFFKEKGRMKVNLHTQD